MRSWALSRYAGAAATLAAVALLAALVSLPQDLQPPARVALVVFGTAIILWVSTRLDAAWVAAAGAASLVLFGAVQQTVLIAMLGHDVIWLMIGAFVLGAAFETSGLAARATAGVLRWARTTSQLFWITSLLLIPLTFMIPSTSGRAAAARPALGIFPDDADGWRRRRAYAILIPVVILVATTAALTGAGSHLLIEDLLVRGTNERFGPARWALWGIPFAAASSGLACAVVLRMFLTPEERSATLRLVEAPRCRLTSTEWRVIAIAAGTLGLWFTTGWHRLGIATVALLAVLAVTAPVLGVMKTKVALKAVNWNLVLFVGGAMILGQALIDTRAAAWLIERLFEIVGLDDGGASLAPEMAVLLALSAISIASHLFITSHVARAAALGPPMLQVAQTAGLEPLAVLFIATVGMNYCLSLPVCSKALLLFQDAGGTTFRSRDLVKLSCVLAPLNLALMIVVYFVWWKWTGLALRT